MDLPGYSRRIAFFFLLEIAMSDDYNCGARFAQTGGAC